MTCRVVAGAAAIFSICVLFGCQGLQRGVNEVTVDLAGAGEGSVTSSPAGISCPPTCSATFRGVSQVTLTATPVTAPTAQFGFGGWSVPAGTATTATTGTCTGTASPCTVSTSATLTANFTASLHSINHIIFLAQENRSFDSYFGALRQYWAQNGYPDQSFDGLPQLNPPSGAAPNTGPAPTNPGCNPVTSTTLACHVDPATGDVGTPVTSFHFNTMCVENPSPSWNESHRDWNASDPVAPPPPTLDGFVASAANDARQIVPPMVDVGGIRAMGYYDGGDLNYYYFLASNFATSDRWFSPVLSRTPPNREYLIGGTSHGYVYPVGSNPNDQLLIPSPPIYQALDQAGISWTIYVDPTATTCSANSNGTCLFKYSYLQNFSYVQNVVNNEPQNIAPLPQFFTDLQNGTLPEVVQIEPSSFAGLDEHPADTDAVPPCCSIQAGAAFVSKIINAVMNSSAWPTTIFVLTFDEPGGFYDHVSPQPAVSPDGIPPSDLLPGDTCTTSVGPNCDFVFTGYRVPVIVISPYSKQNYVSHAANADGTGVDETAILKLIETRFGLPSLTKRDADQLDMSQEFLDFTKAPWKTPPNVPAQATGGACYLDHLP